MTGHLDIERLNEFVDGTLPPADHAAAEVHLGECAGCRADVAELRALLRDAAALPASIEPERDLWPAIASGIDRERTVELVPNQPARQTLWRYRAPLAAAAVLLIMLASGGTALLMRAADDDGQVAASDPVLQPAPVGTRTAPAAMVPVGLTVQSEYQNAIDELIAVLDRRSDELDPQTVEVVRRNLDIIDAAIRDANAALAADPGNGALTHTVAAAYQTKVQLLRRAVELPART